MKPPLEFLIYQQIKSDLPKSVYILENALKGLPTNPLHSFQKHLRNSFPNKVMSRQIHRILSPTTNHFGIYYPFDPDNKDNNPASSLTLCYLTISENMLL